MHLGPSMMAVENVFFSLDMNVLQIVIVKQLRKQVFYCIKY